MSNKVDTRISTRRWIVLTIIVVAALCLSLGAGAFADKRSSKNSISDLRQSDQREEIPIHFFNPPFLVSEVPFKDPVRLSRTGQEVPFLISKATAQVTIVKDGDSSHPIDRTKCPTCDVYDLKVRITGKNNWNQRLTMLGIGLGSTESGWRGPFLLAQDLSIEPLSEFEVDFHREVILPRTLNVTALYVTAESGQAEHGSGWGVPPPPPPPPPKMKSPPPPPPPPRPKSSAGER